MLRTIRLIKLKRLLRHFNALKTVGKIGEAIRASIPAVLTVMMLFLMLIYFFGIVFTVTVGKKREIYAPYEKVSGWNWRDYFGSCGTTMQTLIILATKSEWSTNIVRPVVLLLLLLLHRFVHTSDHKFIIRAVVLLVLFHLLCIYVLGFFR